MLVIHSWRPGFILMLARHCSSYQHYSEKPKIITPDSKEVKPSPKTNKEKKVEVKILENSSSKEIKTNKAVEVKASPVKIKDIVEVVKASMKVNKNKLEVQTLKASSTKEACLQV